MPKEIVFVGGQLVDMPGRGEYDPNDPVIDVRESPYPAYERGIVVRWDKNGYVELGVAKVALGDHLEREQHYTQGMSRQQINRLIRILRIARDGAHGKDA